jgi:alkylated DNA nucleotide flippase Atl1
MQVALQSQVIREYEGKQLRNFQKIESKIKKLEGKECGYKIFTLTPETTLTLNTFLFHRAQQESLAPFLGNSQQLALAKEVGITNLGQLFFALSCLEYREGTSWAKTLGYQNIRLSVSQLELLLEELERNWENYRGNYNQIKLAKKVGVSHLVHLFSALKNLKNKEGLSWAKVLGYKRIELPAAVVDALLKELEENWENYLGNQKQIELAKKAGISHLGNFFAALYSLKNKEGQPWAKVLGYKRIDLPVVEAESLLKELGKNWKGYLGNQNQVKLAEKVGISHLGHLFCALSHLKDKEGLPWAEVLGYQRIDLPLATLKPLIKELETNWRNYLGDENQLSLALKVGIPNLGQLFTALSSLKNEEGLPWVKVLGYHQINLPAAKVRALLKELKENWENYLGDENQLNLARKVGISNLTQLFSALTNLKNEDGVPWARVLGHHQIHLTLYQVESLLIELRDNWRKYRGDQKQVELAKKVEISHLGLLFSALSNLKSEKGIPWAEVLEYHKINLPVSQVEDLLKELEVNWEKYRGNHRQIDLAGKVGITHLGHLFTALSHLNNQDGIPWSVKLNYKMINLPLGKIKDFFVELVTLVEVDGGPSYHKLSEEFSKLTPTECRRKFKEIKKHHLLQRKS